MSRRKRGGTLGGDIIQNREIYIRTGAVHAVLQSIGDTQSESDGSANDQTVSQRKRILGKVPMQQKRCRSRRHHRINGVAGALEKRIHAFVPIQIDVFQQIDVPILCGKTSTLQDEK